MKSDRQLKILEIIGKEEIRTQEDLLAALRREGYEATQATISRDIKELHLQKVSAGPVGTKYAVAPSPAVGNASADKYRAVLREVLTDAVPAGNIGVIKTLSGTANAAAAALEAMQMPEIIGTLAGDDTLLVLFGTDRAAFEFCRKIATLYLGD